MVSRRSTSARSAGITPIADHARHSDLFPWPQPLPVSLGPNEYLSGTAVEQGKLDQMLAVQRANVTFTEVHPNIDFTLLQWLVNGWPSAVAREVFNMGLAVLEQRYHFLGLSRLLPADRVWVGVRAIGPHDFGGFHHPNQGYRHEQMAAVLTRSGPPTKNNTTPLELPHAGIFRITDRKSTRL